MKWRVELPLTTEEYQRFFAIIRGARNPPPALRFDLTLVGHGYQVDVFQNGTSEGSVCADFAGTHDEVRLRERFAEAVLGAIRALTKLL